MMKSRNEYYQYIKDEISINEVCEKLEIVTKSVGDDYVCSCIFHRDLHPSMHIYSEAKTFYCFECDRGGNIYTLLEHKLECNFNGALQWLEREYPYLLKEKPRVKANLDGAIDKTGFEIAYEKYADMTAAEENQLQVFAKKRGYETEFLIDSDIFYAKGKKLHHAYVKDSDLHIGEMERLKESQLISPLPMVRTDKEIRYNDYFQKDRVIITLRNERGKICGFVGRSVRENDKPKYLFTRGLPKSQLLYRLDVVEKKLGKKNESQKLFIVEGMFDALRLEMMGYCAVAVLGNRLVDKQIAVLENVIDKVGANVSLSLFLDTDRAGLNGTIASIKRIWKSKVLKKCYLEIQILKDGTKDPDEAFKGKNATEGVSYTAFEFLMRYYLKEEEEKLENVDLKACYVKISTEARIVLLHKLEDIVPKQEWEELFDYYDRVIEGTEQDGNSDSAFSYFRIRNFILGDQGKSDSIEQSENYLWDNRKTEEIKDYQYQMQTALQIARTSYERQEIKLDDITWERIALGADAFFDYLYEIFRKEETIPVPMITMQVPKKLGVTRRKAMYCHEELLLQQYVLNELLTRGEHEGFERSIPAVRFQSGMGTYVTGYEYPDLANEVISFAYQIDMAAISGTVEIKRGMYRPFYECWKEYIGYIQSGIEQLEGNTVYRVKLDIQGYYDNLRNYVLRDAMHNSIAEAVKYDERKFIFFREEDVTGNEIAEKVVEWILKELFKVDYYDSKDGTLKQYVDYDCGIPQGPDLSSYVANVALFSVDQEAQRIVREVNANCEDGKIRARYARYVDDMIIVTSSPDILLRIKEAIVARLYEMNLNLSPKTEEEDGISKEDAYEWTMEERGGFGVSAGFDMPDDTSTSLMEEYEEYEVTDRRGALKLLQSNLTALLYEGVEGQQAEWETFFAVFFQTEEVRYLDIVRFSEMLIYHAVKQDGRLVDSFVQIWEKGKEQVPEGSLFLEDGLEVLAFLDGCRRILLRQENPGNPMSYQTWEIVDKKIKKENNDIYSWVLESVIGKNILEENRWLLNLKLIEFRKLTNGRATAVQIADNIETQNEYWYRFMWYSTENRAELMKLRPNFTNESKVLQDFHFFMEALRRIEKSEDFKDVKSILKNYETYEKVGYDILLGCFKCWVSENTICNSEDAERSLRVLLNTIPSDYKAEIIGQMNGLKEYLFSVNEDKHRYEYLPVYPGIKYPGIMMSIKEKEAPHIKAIKRADLVDGRDFILNPEKWKSKDDINNHRRLYEKKLSKSNVKYVNLVDYCHSSDETLYSQKALKIIADIYPMLQKRITLMNEKIEVNCENKRLVLSARNVILEISGTEISGIDVEDAYLISSQITSNVVAIERGNEQYELQVVYEKGAADWISGYLLQDACKVEAVRFAALERGDNEIRDAEMLKFSMRRLYGHTFQMNGGHYRGEKSYENSVERTINLIKEYLSSSEEVKECFLTDAKIINSFIETKLSYEYGEFPDQDLGNAVWAKNYLRSGFHDLKKLFNSNIYFCDTACQEERRVPKWYFQLAEHIDNLYEKNNKLYGLKTLAAGIYADAVLILLRMQVLECIRAFDENQCKSFLAESVDLPFQELGLEGKELLITGGDISTVYRNFISDKRDEDGVKKITHLGWLVLLAKVYEIDKNSNYIVFDENIRIDRNVLRDELKKIAELITLKQETKQQESYGFPFEKMSNFFNVWKKENVSIILQRLNSANLKYGAVVRKMTSSTYRQRIIIGKRIRIDTEQNVYKEQKYFLTYGKANSDIKDVESSLEDPSLFIYTQTSIRGTVVGMSAISPEFGELLQQWEELNLNVETRQKTDTTSQMEELREDMVSVNDDSVQLEKPVHQISNEQEIEKFYYNFQSAAWKRRGETKFFINAGRIALFQFRIDSSYRHPVAEICKRKEKNNKQIHITYESCAEFRRRKILEPVMKACADFGVEILLLPEYSTRPETVHWMLETIKKENYNFSVWAGTFRIPAGYKFDGNNTIDNNTLNNQIFWHSAPLPVILNTGEKSAEIIIKKFKKYPAVALKEDINPTPAYEVYSTFSPVMYKYAEEQKTRYTSKDAFGKVNVMPYFYDVRDDVIELICAEFFAVSSISNYPSFIKESLCAYSDYNRPDLIKEKNTIKKQDIYKEYESKYMNNLKEFGKYTALYQHKDRHIRTPILLVPACATRAADYYVFGQGFYLSAGLKTVFCNAVGTGGHGGSCFIGPDSWDNKKINYDEFLMENTIYHGLKPGIFMQTSQMKNRGALGDNEQALLICDVYPELEKRNPNSESMLSAFSLVAHIPIFEERNYDGCCKEEEKCSYCNNYEKEKAEKRRETFRVVCNAIEAHCKKNLKNTFSYDEENEQERKDMEEIVKKLKYLGETYQSEWFVNRAANYEINYRRYPQAWPPPTLTDWLYVEIKYGEFLLDNTSKYSIQIPSYKRNNKK